MHVGAPRMMRSPDHPARLRLAAKIEYQGRLAPSDELWFEFDEALEESISTSGSPWLLAALPLAFARGEPLSVEAQVDPVLVANAQALQTVWAGWYPRFQPIELRVDPQSQASKSAGRSACFFSGGVDSYYTMLHSRGSGGPAIDDLLLVHGFDISIGEQAGWLQARDSALAASRAWGTPLITIGTNLRATRFREVHWDRLGSGPALGSVGLLLEKCYDTIYISSTWSGDALHPLSSHPQTDPHYSTRSTTFIHYGDWANRIPKTEFISRDPLALQHLRVCWQPPGGANCGRCLKCVRTMIALDILGKLEEATAFPAGGLDLEHVRHLYLGDKWRYYKHLIPFARSNGREDVAAAIEGAFEFTARMDRLMLAGLVRRAQLRWRDVPWARSWLRPLYRSARAAARLVGRVLP
jgi:hypothetical protein